MELFTGIIVIHIVHNLFLYASENCKYVHIYIYYNVY